MNKCPHDAGNLNDCRKCDGNVILSLIIEECDVGLEFAGVYVSCLLEYVHDDVLHIDRKGLDRVCMPLAGGWSSLAGHECLNPCVDVIVKHQRTDVFRICHVVVPP